MHRKGRDQKDIPRTSLFSEENGSDSMGIKPIDSLLERLARKWLEKLYGFAFICPINGRSSYVCEHS